MVLVGPMARGKTASLGHGFGQNIPSKVGECTVVILCHIGEWSSIQHFSRDSKHAKSTQKLEVSMGQINYRWWIFHCHVHVSPIMFGFPFDGCPKNGRGTTPCAMPCPAAVEVAAGANAPAIMVLAGGPGSVFRKRPPLHHFLGVKRITYLGEQATISHLLIYMVWANFIFPQRSLEGIILRWWSMWQVYRGLVTAARRTLDE